MKSHLHIALPPSKPTMIFDGDCNFCKLWVRRWQQATGDCVEYIAFQDPRVANQLPELPREKFETAVHLIEPDGVVYSGAEAVFRSLATNPTKQRLRRWYEDVPAFRGATEWVYRFVASLRVRAEIQQTSQPSQNDRPAKRCGN
jgi:predicted DCC family thiol-disulfide oxidoreductase YuxK